MVDNTILLSGSFLRVLFLLSLCLPACLVVPYKFCYVFKKMNNVRASLHTETVEDLIRISVEGPQLEDYDARQDVKQWFSQGKKSRRPNYKSWPLE